MRSGQGSLKKTRAKQGHGSGAVKHLIHVSAVYSILNNWNATN